MCARSWEWCLSLELVLLLSWLFLVTSIQVPSAPGVITISGSNVSLTISEQLSDYEQLSWYYTSAQKIAEWDLGKTTYFNSKFKGRVKLGDPATTLHIFQVQKEDSSTYILQVLYKTGNEQEWKFPLKVFDPVPKPVIKIEEKREKNNSCYVRLSCEIHDESVKSMWFTELGPLPKERQKSVLEITLKPDNHATFVTCQFSNPASSQNNTIYLSSPCTPAQSFGVIWTATWLEVMIPFVLGCLFIWD
ncbi:CD48 antigen [Tamandua tetradactyla]|uniref:CD48 antigen n=1 Tax=Tamandua tetradactyla TaxID=48850 RepID=UPI0040539D8E